MGWGGGCLPGCPSVDCPAEASSQLSSGSACSASGCPQVSLVESPSPRTRVSGQLLDPSPLHTLGLLPLHPDQWLVAVMQEPVHTIGGAPKRSAQVLAYQLRICANPPPAQDCDQTVGSQTVHTLPVGSLGLPVPKPHGGIVLLIRTQDSHRMEQMRTQRMERSKQW